MLELRTLSSLINKKGHLTCDTRSSLQAQSDVQVSEKQSTCFQNCLFKGQGWARFTDLRPGGRLTKLGKKDVH